MCWTTEMDPRQGSQVPEWAELWRKTGQRGLLIASCQGLENDSDTAVTPVAEAAPAHLVLPQSRWPKQLHHLHAQPTLGRGATGKKKKKKSCVYTRRVASVVSNPLWHWKLWPRRLLCQGGLQPRILESIGQYGLSYSSRAHPAVLAANSPEYLVLQNPYDLSSYTTSTPGSSWGRPKSSRVASGANPSGQPTCRDGHKTTSETQGRCG